MSANHHVAILGASTNPERYSYIALDLLKSHGYPVSPIHPSGKPVCDLPCFKHISDIEKPIDTLSIYVKPQILSSMLPDIIKAHPARAIFNPGTEDDVAMAALKDAGVRVVCACTIVLEKTGQFLSV